jgi:hypothetical protein
MCTTLEVHKKPNRRAIICLPVIVVLSIAWAAPVTAADESVGSESVTMDSIREAVREFNARREAAPREPQASASSAGPSEAFPSLSREPPRGASPQGPGAEATAVETEPQRLSRATAKPAPEKADAPPAKPDSYWRQISFSSSWFTPERGIDERLLRAAAAAGGRGNTYAFVLTNEFPTAEMERELQSLGVILLGPHDSALKVRVPLRRETFETILALPYVDWLGYSLPEQKIAVELERSLARSGTKVAQFPIIINLFEADSGGEFADRIRAIGVDVVQYDADLHAYTALASSEEIRALTGFDFVLFIEIERPSQIGHDQSMATNGVDYIRAGVFRGASTVLGIMDSGFMLGTAAATMHADLNKFGCGDNFTSDAAGVWNDERGHGTAVLATIVGTGAAEARYRGVAIDSARTPQTAIRAAKIFPREGGGMSSWALAGMDFMSARVECDYEGHGRVVSPRPQVVNYSGSVEGTRQTGTDSLSRKLDSKVWEFRQAYIVSAGNKGPGVETVGSPGVAKNALTVGNVQDYSYLLVGELANSSSRGPTGDQRMKPNLVATGDFSTSASAGTTKQYRTAGGSSQATAHVTGIAATLLEHYPEFRDNPALLRAQLMATSVLHGDEISPSNNNTGGRNDYGLGRLSAYQAHWAHLNPNGWSVTRTWGTVTDRKWLYYDLVVPSAADRLILVMSWDEPEASAGASRAITYDLDLWADHNADCTADAGRRCGEWVSQSSIDNTEYLIIDNPPPGTYRLKMVNWYAPAFGLPVAIAAKVIEGDPTPAISLTATLDTDPIIGLPFTVKASMHNPAYEAYGVHLSIPEIPNGITVLAATTVLEDGVVTSSTHADARQGPTLGSIVQGDSRTVVWELRIDTPGTKTIPFQAWSDNGGTQRQSITVTPF